MTDDSDVFCQLIDKLIARLDVFTSLHVIHYPISKRTKFAQSNRNRFILLVVVTFFLWVEVEKMIYMNFQVSYATVSTTTFWSIFSLF